MKWLIVPRWRQSATERPEVEAGALELITSSTTPNRLASRCPSTNHVQVQLIYVNTIYNSLGQRPEQIIKMKR